MLRAFDGGIAAAGDIADWEFAPLVLMAGKFCEVLLWTRKRQARPIFEVSLQMHENLIDKYAVPNSYRFLVNVLTSQDKDAPHLQSTGSHPFHTSSPTPPPNKTTQGNNIVYSYEQSLHTVNALLCGTYRI